MQKTLETWHRRMPHSAREIIRRIERTSTGVDSSKLSLQGMLAHLTSNQQDFTKPRGSANDLLGVDCTLRCFQPTFQRWTFQNQEYGSYGNDAVAKRIQQTIVRLSDLTIQDLTLCTITGQIVISLLGLLL